MSSAGQIVGGVVGAVAGAFVGSPMLGAQLGMMLGGALDPPKGPTVIGPRLEDLTIQTSTYGATVPRVYGTVPVLGNVFWLENNKIKETVTKKKSGGKGGGSKTTTKTFTYSATFAVGLADTKSLGGPIVGVKRIWIGPDLWYDAGSSDMGTIAASNAAAEGFEVYLGSNTQNPDPRISAALGVNASAYRGVAYIVFYDLALAKYGNSLAGAQVKVEVVCNGTISNYAVTQTSISDRNWGPLTYNGAVYCALNASSSNICSTSYDGVTWTERVLPKTDAWLAIGSNSKIIIACGYGSTCTSEDNGITWVERTMPANHYCTDIVWNGEIFLIATDSGPFFTSTTGKSWAQGSAPMYQLGYGNMSYRGLGWNGNVFVAIAGSGTGDFCYSETGLDGSWASGVQPVGNNWTAIGTLGPRFCITSNNYAGTYTSDDGINWTYNASNFPGYGTVVASDGSVLCATSYGDYCVSADGVTWEIKPFPGGSVNAWNGLVWGGAVFVAVRGGTGLSAIIQPYKVVVSTPSLSNIVSSEALQSGLLAAGDIDVTGLTQQVKGYRIGSIGAIRSAIEPLQGVWPFDVVQHGYKIQFKVRGSGSVVTIPDDDLDARSASSSPGVSITTSRETDVQLPTNVTIKYLDYGRDYEVGEQYSERTTVNSVNLRVIDVPVVLTDSEAAGMSETLLYLYWLERHEVSFNLPPTYNQLEPADVVTLETPEGNVSLRLTSVNNTSEGIVECQARYNLDSIYTPAAVAASPVVSGPTTIAGPSLSFYVLLDIPYVHTALADPAFLCAMYGQNSSWTAGILFRTDDAGSTWTDIQAFAAPGGTLGIVSNSIGVVDSRVWDKSSSLTVSMLSGTLSSVTDIAVLNGSNYFAYGAHGRWEIVGIQICTLVSGTIYTCSDMIRGAKGTEWTMGLHQAGDMLVLLDESYVTAIGMSTSSIGLSRAYRGITDGSDISSDTDYDFTYNAVNLECLSPVQFKAHFWPTTSNWDFAWIRRSRTDGEWRDRVDAGVGETTEAYEVDIFADSGYATLKRTITTTAQSCTYTLAQQTTDFGSYQAEIYARVYQMSSVVGKGYPASGNFGAIRFDANWSQVVLSMPMDAAGILDLKSHTPTIVGSTTISSTQYFTGGRSCYFDGSGDRITFAASADWNLGNTFTIEFSIYPLAYPTSGEWCRIYLIGENGSGSALTIQFNDVGQIGIVVPNGSGGLYTSGAAALNTWSHYEFSVSTGTAYIFKSGASAAGPTAITTQSSSSSDGLIIGYDTAASSIDFNFYGYVDRVRITKGVARHTAAFTFDPNPFPTQ
jgi:hypothetical protein